MRKPVVGITVGRYNHWTPRNEIQTSTVGCPLEYQNSILRAGGSPVLLPRTHDKEAIASAMGVIDGLLLSGGGDIVSLAYGEEPHPASIHQDPVRDQMEFEAVRLAVQIGLPILGICRGIQSLNVALGGTLIQDIPSQVPNAVQHYTDEVDSVLGHTIEIEPDSLLAKVLGSASVAVNSWHHQAVKATGKGLRVSARARDGVIEGLEAEDDRPILAVQCHPEDSSTYYDIFRRLFDWFVAEAGKRRAS